MTWIGWMAVGAALVLGWRLVDQLRRIAWALERIADDEEDER